MFLSFTNCSQPLQTAIGQQQSSQSALLQESINCVRGDEKNDCINKRTPVWETESEPFPLEDTLQKLKDGRDRPHERKELIFMKMFMSVYQLSPFYTKCLVF